MAPQGPSNEALLGSANVVQTIVTGLAGTAFLVLTFDAPVITRIVEMNAPAGSATVSIRGANFGSYDTTASVAIGGKLCSSLVWNSNTAVTCGALGSAGM